MAAEQPHADPDAGAHAHLGSVGSREATTCRTVLKGTFNIDEDLYDVCLRDDAITWQGSGKDKVPVVVRLNDVICVAANLAKGKEKGNTLEAEGEQGQGDTNVKLDESVNESEQTEGTISSNAFTLHYITRNPNRVWRNETVTFQAMASTNKADIGPWVTYIRDYCCRFSRPKRLLVFINPISGGGNGVQIYKTSAEPIFELGGVETKIVTTENENHINTFLMSEDLSSFDGIVSVGGDGTFFQCLNALLRRVAKDSDKDLNDPAEDPVMPSILIGIIPAGSGQMMVKDAMLSDDPETAALHIVTGQQYRAHLYSVYNAGKLMSFGTLLMAYGFLGDVIGLTETSTMRLFGRARYMVSIIRNLWSPRTYNSRVSYKPAVTETETLSKDKFTAKVKSDGDANVGDQTGWKSIEGGFCAFTMFLITTGTKLLEKRFAENEEVAPDQNVPILRLFQLKNTCPRLKILRSLGAMLTGNESSLNHEYASNFKTLEFKLDIDVDELGDGNNCLNIDGEAFRLEDKTLHVRSYANLVPMFGMGLWKILGAAQESSLNVKDT